jgi:hypothetical protein
MYNKLKNLKKKEFKVSIFLNSSYIINITILIFNRTKHLQILLIRV